VSVPRIVRAWNVVWILSVARKTAGRAVIIRPVNRVSVSAPRIAPVWNVVWISCAVNLVEVAEKIGTVELAGASTKGKWHTCLRVHS